MYELPQTERGYIHIFFFFSLFKDWNTKQITSRKVNMYWLMRKGTQMYLRYQRKMFYSHFFSLLLERMREKKGIGISAIQKKMWARKCSHSFVSVRILFEPFFTGIAYFWSIFSFFSFFSNSERTFYCGANAQ